MDDEVFVLSSDEELSPSPKKKPKTALQTTSMRLAANKQLTIRSTKLVHKTVVPSTRPPIFHHKNVDTKKATQTILLPNNRLKPSGFHSKNNNVEITTIKQTTITPSPSKTIPEGKYFQKKISTGEITLVPLSGSDKQKDLPVTVKQKPESKSPVIEPKRVSPTIAISSSLNLSPKPAKRVAPTKISDEFLIRANSLEKSSDSDMLSRDSSVATNDETATALNPQLNGVATAATNEVEAKRRKTDPETPINEAYQALIDACRAADTSNDMDKMINRKLIKYYQSVHADFVNSKSFCKTVRKVALEIRAQPKLVYLKISGLLEELNSRRLNDRTIVEVDEDDDPTMAPKTGDAKKDAKIQRLSRALYKLKKLIAKNEEAEVDWDDEINSKFMITERYKKRAWEIYSKICDITGESKSAERLVKKPIKFKGTMYPEFNRKLERFVNDTHAFPDMYDVIRCLDFCNKKFAYRLRPEDIKRIAQDAFIEVGNSLQKRRKTDLYEMVTYFTQNQLDPALEDPSLRTKLDDNLKRNREKMREVIEKFSRQDQGEDINAGASTSNNQSDNNQVNSIKKPVSPPTTVTKATENLLNASDDVVLVSESGVDDFFGEISRNIEENDLGNAFGMDFQIESVESLHPSLLNFDESQIQVIDDSL